MDYFENKKYIDRLFSATMKLMKASAVFGDPVMAVGASGGTIKPGKIRSSRRGNWRKKQTYCAVK
ncbi:hypothetical protein SAMN05661091_4040 [Paenibacillus uliginis N3/975]|uniref:Uncharacterized protein n=1 Tax=Paenibacillus uliginis N3/975 TaxID=1313296 RepID=A0A1X7HJT9_9BACL|nr:hypothetical protein SAMN05661091_4040 [Paenibacillus uliginis N3/975]